MRRVAAELLQCSAAKKRESGRKPAAKAQVNASDTPIRRIAKYSMDGRYGIQPPARDAWGLGGLPFTVSLHVSRGTGLGRRGVGSRMATCSYVRSA